MPLYKYKYIFRFLLATIIVSICWLAFTELSLPRLSSGHDKLNHLFAFAILALLFDYSFPLKTKSLIATLLGFGIFIELIQATIPSRSTSYWDIVADLIGITSYLIIQPLRAKIHG